VRVLVGVAGRDAGLVIHRQRPVLEVDDLELRRDDLAADLRDPGSDLRTDPPRARAPNDDENR
jgi:hypothetical protein